VDVGTVVVAGITAAAAISGTLIGVVAQNHNARKTREDALRDQKRTAYREFLDVEHELRTALASSGKFTTAEYSRWANRFFEQFHLVELIAPPDVCALARQLNSHFAAIENQRLNAEGGDLLERLTNAYGAHEDAIEGTRGRLVEAMRADVAVTKAKVRAAPDDRTSTPFALRPSSEPEPVPEPEPEFTRGAEPAPGQAEERHIAIVSTHKSVTRADLDPVARALEKQLRSDVGPWWNVSATVEAFDKEKDIPADYWVVRVLPKLQYEGSLSYHTFQGARATADILGPNDYGISWTLTMSHECIEMLVNPYQERLAAGSSPRDLNRTVLFPVEACNACQDERHGYRIDDVLVSDFVTPHYFDRTRREGVTYDHQGVIGAPRQIAAGGYILWKDPKTNDFDQVFAGEEGSADLDDDQRAASPVRGTVVLSLFAPRAAADTT
jgi:hypothetical protein